MTVTEESWDEAPMLTGNAGIPAAKPVDDTERWEDAKPALSDERSVNGMAFVPQVNGRAFHSEEAERHILACILLEGENGEEGNVLKKSREAGIGPESFYSPRNRLVFQICSRLNERKVSPSTITLVEELKSSRQLDSIGGMMYIMELTGNIPTTAHADYFIRKLKQEQANRAEVKRAMEIVERANRGEDVGIVDAKRKVGDLLTSSLFTTTTLIAKPTPIFTAADTTICTPGNLTALYSQAKAGKTATIGGMLAATMELPGALNDTLGFKGSNTLNKAVIHFDTEQSRYDWQQMILTATKRAKLSSPPDWLKSHILTGMNVGECRMLLEAAMIKYSQDHNGIYALFLDGVGDLVTDVNEPKECNEFVAYLHGLAIKYDCAIILILHLNPTSESKGRGHLGSQLQRKVESNLMLEKSEDGTTRLYATQQRGKMITKDKALCFRWSDEAGMHVSVKSEAPINLKGGRPKKYLLSRFTDMIPKTKAQAMGFRALLKYANDKTGIKESAFRDVLDEGVMSGDVIQIPGQGGYFYYLNLPGQI